MFTPYCLYWIREKSYTNPFEQGYIGISNNVSRRMYEHTNLSIGSKIYNAIHKYGEDVVVDIIQTDLTIEQAKELEKQYRPKMHIGWNVCEGGGLPPCDRENHHNKGRRHKPETIELLKELKRGPNHFNYGKKLGPTTRQKLSERQLGEKNHMWGKKHTEVSNKKRSEALKGKPKPKFKCPHCGETLIKRVVNLHLQRMSL